MAFEFIKKLVARVTGKKIAATGKANRSQAASSNNGRGKHGKRGRHANKTAQVRASSSRNDQSTRKSAAPRAARSGEARVRPARGNRSERRPMRDDRGARTQGAVNTAAGEMRPGGVISAEEMARLSAEHAAWSLEAFQVPVQEGKVRFHDFDLPGEVMHGIADLGFQYCTDIQALSLQHALDGKNVAGKAQTGSGKTAAFLVAILTRYLRTPDKRAKSGGCPRALVIAPTRELVIQICKDAAALGKYTGLRSLAVYGGMDLERQAQELLADPVDLLVATPGRLLDFCKRRVGRIFSSPDRIPDGVDANGYVIDLKNVDTLVIDEADRMLDMGFIPDVSRIMERLPPKNQRATMLYSATLNDSVMELASRWMETPVKMEVESSHNATDTVRQVVYIVRSEDKFKVLFNHLALHPEARAIVFCNRKNTTEDVYESLKIRGVSCEMLSGDVNQNKRLKVLDALRDGEVKVVVATDVAGRGIDIKGLEYVINFDFPYEAEDYVHRIGRTGRAGSTGIAISFADQDESFAIPEIEEYIKEPLKCTIVADDDPLMKALPARHTKLAAVDEVAKAEVDAREAVTEAQKAAASAVIGAGKVGVSVRNAAGRQGVVVLDDSAPRALPTFENALEKKPEVDESDAYSKPVSQQTAFEEWKIDPPAGPSAPKAEALDIAKPTEAGEA